MFASNDLAGLGFSFTDGFAEAFATRTFFGAGLGTGLGVGLGFGVELAVGFGDGVGFGVGEGNSISLFVVLAKGFSSSTSLFFNGLDSAAGIEGFGAGDSCLSDSPVARSSAPPNQTMFSGFDDALAARLQRISPAISATCASAMRTTFRQNRAGARHELYELPRISSAIVKGS